MNQIQQMNNLSKKKQEFCKYIYIEDTPIGRYMTEGLRKKWMNLDNEKLVNFFYDYFFKYIHAYFFINRTKFNKIRSLFMNAVWNVILEYEKVEALMKYCYFSYENWSEQVSLSECRACKPVYDKLIEEMLKDSKQGLLVKL